VGGVGPGDRDAGDAHALGVAHVLVREGGGRIGVGDVVARHPVIGEAHGGEGGAVVGLVVAGGRHGEGSGGDVGGGGGAGVEGVVGGVGPGDGDAGDAHALGVAHVLVREGRGRIGAGDVVARHPVIGEAHGGEGGAVVDLVVAGGAHGQGPGGDVGGRAGR